MNIRRGIAAFATMLCMTTLGLAATGSASGATTPGCVPDIGKKVPVVMVHGFLGKPDAWTSGSSSMTNSLAGVSGIYVDKEIIDYQSYNTSWVDDPHIGPMIAKRIACLATSSRKAGGPGKVIVIAHSMGGLATRWAATEASNASEVAKDIGLVITIGTPSDGSGWPNLLAGMSASLCDPLVAYHKVVGGDDNDYCGLHGALGALEDQSTQIGKLKKWPDNIAVKAIAGDVTIMVPLFPLKLPYNTHSDLVVSNKSALNGMKHTESGGGQLTVACGGDLKDMALQQVLPVIPNCWHSALTHNSKVEDEVVSSIKKYLASLEPGAKYAGTWFSDAGIGMIMHADGTAKFGSEKVSDTEFGFAVKFTATSKGLHGTVTKVQGNPAESGIQVGESVDLETDKYFDGRTVGLGGIHVEFGGGKMNEVVMYKQATLPKSVLAPFVGDRWYGPGRGLTIKADSTGVIDWDAGQCGGGTCIDRAQVLFDGTSGNSIIGVITSAETLTSDGRGPAPDGTPLDFSLPQPGYAFKLKVSGHKLLYATWDEWSGLNRFNRQWCWVGETYPYDTCREK